MKGPNLGSFLPKFLILEILTLKGENCQINILLCLES